MSTDIADRFAVRANEARKRRQLTISELAAKAGIKTSTAAKILHGANGATLGNAVALASALGLSLDALARSPECVTCEGMPPVPFICPDCGAGAVGGERA